MEIGTVSTQSPDHVRKHLRTILDDLSVAGGAVIIERYREPKAVLISYTDYLSVEQLLQKRNENAIQA